MVRLKHVHSYTDRHGRRRHYLRLPGRAAIRLPGEPGSAEFLAAYQAGLSGPAKAPGPRLPPRHAAPGTMDALAASYYASAAWAALSPSSQRTYRRILERLRAAYGHLPVSMMEPKHLRAIVAQDAGTAPAAANHRRRMLRALMQHAIATGLREDDPSRDVARVAYREGSIATWTEAQIAQFEAHWPSGSKPRLAFALLLYTAQRRSDVVRMGRQHLAGGWLKVTQQKTAARLDIPVHPQLAAELAQIPEGQLTFLLTPGGKPYSPNGFYMRFAGWVSDAGLPAGLSPHGLRKAACRRLAEAGCTASQIMAISGHKTLAEVQRYTREVEQRAMAETAMARIKR